MQRNSTEDSPYQRQVTEGDKSEQMIDTHIKVTQKAHEQMPLQSYLRIAWFFFTLLVVYVWTRVWFDNDLSTKTCFVQENIDGTYTMVNYVEDGLLKHDNITNVSSRFEYLSMSYLAQGVLSLFTVSY